MSSRVTVSQITRFVRRQKFVLAGLIIVMSVGAVSLYTKPANQGNPQLSENMSQDGAPPLAKFITHAAPKILQTLNVQKADGQPTTLAAIASGNEPAQASGLTLVNYWATWCAPCRKEMPQLRRFGRRVLDGQPVRVITLSVDRWPGR
jgi:thiol-disulfide isomerase/thioredoxin